MNRAAPRWTPVNIDRPPERRRRLSPLFLAIALASLVWLVIAIGGVALGVWLT